MKCMVAGVLLLMGLGLGATDVCATGKGKDKGYGRQQSGVGTQIERVAEQAAEEAIDAVADELFDEEGRITTTGARPPGLSKKGTLPPGLEKQGKVPEGWSKGKKSGWEETEGTKREGLIRRVIRGIFGRRQSTSTDGGD